MAVLKHINLGAYFYIFLPMGTNTSRNNVSKQTT